MKKIRFFLRTDASDYGVDAYHFQIRKGKEIPIIFLSKALTEEQFRWSTPEKEAYAIVYAFNELEHLIRDRSLHYKLIIVI